LVWERSGSAVPGGRERMLQVRERGGKRIGSARERDASGQGRERDLRVGSAVREVRSAAGSAVPRRSRSERADRGSVLRFGYLGKWSPCAYESLSTKGEDYYPCTLLYDSNFTLT
jgi:hypothetical protein